MQSQRTHALPRSAAYWPVVNRRRYVVLLEHLLLSTTDLCCTCGIQAPTSCAELSLFTSPTCPLGQQPKAPAALVGVACNGIVDCQQKCCGEPGLS